MTGPGCSPLQYAIYYRVLTVCLTSRNLNGGGDGPVLWPKVYGAPFPAQITRHDVLQGADPECHEWEKCH